MSETPTYKRIIEERLSHEIFSNDYLVKDSATEGTTRILISEFIDLVLADSATEEDLETAVHNFVPEYDSATSYSVGNYCIYLNELYRCTTATTGDFDENDWTSVDVMGELVRLVNNEAYYRSMSDIVLSEDIAEPYDTTKSYIVGDIVSYNLYIYRCTGATTGTWDASKWEQVTVDELFDDLNFSANAISYDNTSSGLEAENVQDAIDEVVADVDAVETALETKAEQSGVYDDLVAGNLLSDSYTADSTPYLYRQSPSASSVEQNIIGGTVAWNQLVQNGNFASTSNWTVAGQATLSVSNNIANLTPTAQWGRIQQGSIPFITNHKYYCHYELKGKSTTTYSEINGTGRYVSGTDWNIFSKVIVGDSTKAQMVIFGESATSDFVTITIKNVQIFDLTQAFGSTIADYIYSLEQATAGSGIAWLKANGFLTKDYYPYDAGSLQSVKTSGRKIVGFNQWDEVWENGRIGITDGTNINGNGLRSKNYISCLKNTMYYAVRGNYDGASSFTLFYYDDNKNFISYESKFGSNVTFTIPSNAYYLRFNVQTSSAVTTYNNDICINISDASKNGTYEPYTSTTYPTSPIDLRGLFKLENGNLVADGDVYSADGSVKRKYGVVDLGSLNWTYASDGLFYTTSLPKECSGVQITNAICSIYMITNVGSSSAIQNMEMVVGSGYVGSSVNKKTVLVRNRTYSNATAFKTAMNGVYLVYELATPTSETADAYENPQLVGSTEEFIDTRDVPIPVGGERKYHADLKAKLEELAKIPDVPSANGTYTLKATRSASGVEYSWVSD